MKLFSKYIFSSTEEDADSTSARNPAVEYGIESESDSYDLDCIFIESARFSDAAIRNGNEPVSVSEVVQSTAQENVDTGFDSTHSTTPADNMCVLCDFELNAD